MINTLYPSFQRWSEKGSVWLYSDPHFEDTDMREYFGYPSEEEQVANINKKVGKYDTIIILGDIGDAVWLSKIRGYKVILTGNHDPSLHYYDIFFDEIYNGPLFISDKLLLSHEQIILPFAFNIHGHDHAGEEKGPLHLNVCANKINFEPVNLGALIKQGILSKVPSIHRLAIDVATVRKEGRQNER